MHCQVKMSALDSLGMSALGILLLSLEVKFGNEMFKKMKLWYRQIMEFMLKISGCQQVDPID